MKNDESLKKVGVAMLVVQALLVFFLSALVWHLKNTVLDYLVLVLIGTVLVFGYSMGKMWIGVLLIVFVVGVPMVFSYSPYTHWLISEMEISDSFRDEDKGVVYLVRFGDGSEAAAVFSRVGWVCHGKEYSNKPACAHISSLIQKRLGGTAE